MKRLLASCLLFVFVLSVFNTTVFAKNDEGAIDSKLLNKMQSATSYDGVWKMVYNALLLNDIKKLALDHDKVVTHEDLFNVSVSVKGITNQKSSGRCWLFASLNLMRPMMIDKYKLSSFEFSQNYLAFYDKLEKANMFLEMIIEYRDRDKYDRELQGMFSSPHGDGGWWFYVVELVEKYGCVPMSAMPETQSSSNTGMMNKLLSRKLRQAGINIRDMHVDGKTVAEMRIYKEAVLQEVYKMLTLNLGIPPTEFEWRYEKKGEDDDTLLTPLKTYTPKVFYEKVVDVDLREYITLVDHPNQPKYELYKSHLSRNMYDKEDHWFVNLPIDTLKAYTLKALLEGQTVVFACDVGKENANSEGIFRTGIYDYESVYDISFEMTKSERFMHSDIVTSHMMLITACDTTGGNVSKWKVENSWGTKRGDDGYWTMYDDWYDEYVFEVIIHKDFLSDQILKLTKKEPVTLPLWDPYSEFFRNIK